MDIAFLCCSGPSRKLIVALNIEATFSGVAYAFLDPGETPIIRSLTGVPPILRSSNGVFLPETFFQALSIPTKMARGTVEIVPDVEVATANTRAIRSGPALSKILNNSPFTCGMTAVQILGSGDAFTVF